ncbi:hypothetical protein T439DRAFT_163472 [Meredithblackwellia eburnea MCA 4105]
MPPDKNRNNKSITTLRTLRHDAASSTNATSKNSSSPLSKNEAATMSVKQQIAKRMQKPLIQGRQFKWVSPAQSMRNMNVDLARVTERRQMLEREDEAGDDNSHSLFANALNTTALLNLSIPFVSFSRSVEPKARSLPLVIHHRSAIVQAICVALSAPQPDLELSAENILDLLPPLITDLSSLLVPSLPNLLTVLINLTAPSPLTSANPKLLQRVYDVLGALFRDLGKHILETTDQGGMADVWDLVRRGLGAPHKENRQEDKMNVDESQTQDEGKMVQRMEEEREGEQEEEGEDSNEDAFEPPIASTSAQPLTSLPTTPTFTLSTHLRTTPQTRRLLASSFAFLVRKARSTIAQDMDESELSQLFRMMVEDVAQLEREDKGSRKASLGRGAKGRGKGHGKGRGQEEGNSTVFAEGLVWVTVEACTAPSYFLHSRTSAVLRSLFTAVLGLDTPSSTSSEPGQLPTAIITHSLTSIIHHAKDSKTMEPVLEEFFRAWVDQVGEQREWNNLNTLVKAADTLAGVRKGVKISEQYRPRFFTLLSTLATFLPEHPPVSFLDSLAKSTVSILRLSALSDVLSGGAKQVIQSLFTFDSDSDSGQASASVFATACAVATSLDSMDWSFFDTLVLPPLLSATARLVRQSVTGDVEFGQLAPARNSLTLVANLANSGRLSKAARSSAVAFRAWESAVTPELLNNLKNWTKAYLSSEETEDVQTLELLETLAIIPHLSTSTAEFLPLLVDLALATSATPSNVSRAAYLSTPVNPAHVLGTTLATIGKLTSVAASDKELVRLASALVPLVESFSWHRAVLNGVSSILLSHASKDQSLAAQTKLYDAILPNLLSEDSLLRLSSLRITATLFPASTTPVAADLIAKCIEVEEMPLTVQGAREKSMKLRKIGIVASNQLGRDGEEVTQVLEIVLRYLTAMFKVNFKPLWPEAVQALALLAQRFPDQVWSIASRQLIVAATRAPELFVSRKPEWALDAGVGVDILTLHFEEAQLRCHVLEEVQQTVAARLRLFEDGVHADQARSEALVKAQIAPERLVVQTFEAQLLALLCEIPDLAQRHSRDITEVFFGCFQRDDTFSSADEASTQTAAIYLHADESAKERKLRLMAWLTLYGKFTNPKALYRSEGLGAQFRTLLAFPDAEVQKLALECLLRWKTPSLQANSDRLKNLLEPTKLRDELLQLVSDEDAGGLDPKDRAEVVPLIIRITYGIMTSKLGRASSSSGQGRSGRRAAILGALKTCSTTELGTLVDLTIGPLRRLLVTPEGESFRFATEPPKVMGKRQLGFLGFLTDLLKHLGPALVDRWPDLLGAALNLLHFAHRGIEQDGADEAEPEDEEEDEREDGEGDDGEVQMAPLRRIRQLAMKRTADFFRIDVGFDFTPFVAAAFPSFISPRLPTLPAENAQSPSSMLELFVVWSSRRDLAHFLVDFDSTLLPALYGCLTVRNVKPAVILRVFDIITSLIEFASEDGGKESEIGRTLVAPSVSILLNQLVGLLENISTSIDSHHEVGQRQITILCSLAPYVTSSDQATTLLVLIMPMLRKSNKAVPERLKTDLLKIVTALYPLARPPPNSDLRDKCFDALASLFASAKTRGARLQLVAGFLALAQVEADLIPVATLVQELNSFSVKRSEEPDFDRRLAAFSRLNEEMYTTLRSTEWIVLLHNMIAFIQDPEELAIRSNASFTFRRFIEVASSSDDEPIKTVVSRILLPGLKNSLRSKLEIIRSEVLGVFAFAVERLDGVPDLDVLKSLLVNGDQEANFFNNILHIQTHRRTRALRRLADDFEAGSLSNKTVSDIFIPLIDHFISGTEERKDADLVNETVQCLGRLAKHLSWSSFNKFARQYLKQSRVEGTSQKPSVRSLVAILKSFHFDLDQDPNLLNIVSTRLVPDLLLFLEKREGSDEEVRIPVAEGICAVVQHFPGTVRLAHESTLMMTLSQILRSQDQHLRDLVRITLGNIVVSAGVDAFSTVVKELRRALQRGPQLHVLAYTVHSVLVRLTAQPDGVNFDGALAELIPVLDDDVFGSPAKDRGSQEFRSKTKFKEVRSYKSLDSFQLLAAHVSPSRISALLAPVRDVLQRTDSSKLLKEAEEVLRRLVQGLLSNEALSTTEVLDLCHSLISQNAAFLRRPASKKSKKAAPDHHVQLTPQDGAERDYYSSNAHRFVSFGLDLFNSAFRKSQFDLDSPTIIARLEPLVSLVGNTLYSDDPTVLARSMRATSFLIRCPLTSVDNAAPVLVRQMLSIIQRTGSTESELAQSTLRTLASVIRDCKGVQLEESQLTQLLQLIGPDLEEADRQATLFQLLRSIMARKFVAPEIYDLMDKVAEILITNQSSNIRDICRAVYLQFLLDYPQGRGRLKNSLAFLAKNLSFQHESGRLSVLELMCAILAKFGTQLVDESADLFFIGLVMVVANDESTKCREMAGELVKLLFTRIEKETKERLLLMLCTWVEKRDQPQLARTAIQLLGVAIQGLGEEGRPVAPTVLESLVEVLSESQESLRAAEDAGDNAMELDLDWQLPYQALQSVAHLYKLYPSIVSPDDTDVWTHVRQHLLFPHIWIRTSAARLLGTLFASSASYTNRTDLDAVHPLSSPSLLDSAKKACLQLKSPVLDETLAMQVVKNLFYAAKCFADRKSDAADAEEASGDEGDEGDSAEGDPLRWLLTRLSYQIRQSHTSRPSMHSITASQWSLQPSSILQFFAAVISHLETASIERFLAQMITPIFRITEDPNAQDPQMAELQSLAHEVQSLLQGKIGTTAYANVHTRLRQQAADKRNERKAALAMQAINDPMEDSKRKAKRNEQKARQKKRKNAAFADSKGRFKRLRDE